MRYYLSTCEYKWKHADTDMEQIWIRRELGDEIYKLIEERNWQWKLLRSDSQTLPDDIYCRCDIYVEIPDNKQATHFLIKYPKAQLVEEIK
jgi:hypothetical protein